MILTNEEKEMLLHILNASRHAVIHSKECIIENKNTCSCGMLKYRYLVEQCVYEVENSYSDIDYHSVSLEVNDILCFVEDDKYFLSNKNIFIEHILPYKSGLDIVELENFAQHFKKKLLEKLISAKLSEKKKGQQK